MRIKNSGDLIYWTYHMMDWKKISQSPSNQTCVECGGEMMRVESVEDARGVKYDGFACHTCKRLLWAKATR